MATLNIYKHFPERLFEKFYRVSSFALELYNVTNRTPSVDDVSPVFFNSERPADKIATVVGIGSRWERDGSALVLKGNRVTFQPTDYRNDRYRITHLVLTTYTAEGGALFYAGFIEKTWDFRLVADGGNGPLTLDWSSSGILKIELTHG